MTVIDEGYVCCDWSAVQGKAVHLADCPMLAARAALERQQEG